MFFEILVAGSLLYAGLKKKKKNQKINNMPNEYKQYPAIIKPLSPQNTEKTPQKIIQVRDASEKTKQHYQISLITLVTTGLTPFAPILLPVSIALLIAQCLPIFKAVIKQWHLKRKLGHDLLVLLLSIFGLISGQLLALALALFFYHLGKKLLSQTENTTKAQLANLFSTKPEKVWIIKKGVEIEVPLESINRDDVLVINTGQPIAIDGTITGGAAVIDQHILTGESQPVEKSVGDTVLASTQVLSGRITVRVDKAGTETAVAKIEALLHNSTDNKMTALTKGEQQADQVAMPLMALSTLTFPFGGLTQATGVLNSTFGNRLQLTAPLSMLKHLNLATERGILIKDGRVLEKLPQIDVILFDKTGTLTEEQPHVGRIISCAEDYSVEQVLAEAAAAEMKLVHPIAKAIIARAHTDGLAIPEIHDSNFQIGLGITIKVDNRVVRIGSLRFMQQNDVSISQAQQDIMDDIHEKGHSIVFLAADNSLKGMLEIQPSLRSGVKTLIQTLRYQGIKQLAIVSGDQEKPTKTLAKELGMDTYFAEVMPENKAEIVRQLQDKGHCVCFIGDGVNDSLAIQQADVSISLEGGAHIAQDLAHIIFIKSNLSQLAVLFQIAHSLDKNMRDSLKLLYAPIFINLAGALFLGFGLMATVLINNMFLLLTSIKSNQHSLLENKK